MVPMPMYTASPFAVGRSFNRLSCTNRFQAVKPEKRVEKLALRNKCYGASVRVADDSVHVNLPVAFSVPVACHVAVAAGATRATAATPSPTPLPDASVNFTWSVYRLALLLWLTIFPVAVGWPPVGLVVHAVTLTSFLAAAFADDEHPARSASAHAGMPNNWITGLIHQAFPDAYRPTPVADGCTDQGIPLRT
jgi:hypothetical protein